MSIANIISGGADRRAILEMVRQILGPLYDPEKEDQYVRVIRRVRKYEPMLPMPEIFKKM